jgi:EAL domain-containing protein (putative c-di-GMP-specific phosphodiesterase class I)
MVATSPARTDRRSPQAHKVRQRESIRRLKLALAENRLVLDYQPIFQARNGKPVAAEALLRWRYPDQEAEVLGDLLQAAEDSPVIFTLETWAMHVCFRDAASWQSGPLPDVRVNLNLSAREFRREDLADRLTQAMEESRVDPGRVTLEITETSAIGAPEEVAPLLTGLKDLRLQLWLDDFGTGHSSLAWLSWFPIDGVKIPGLFVSRLPADDRCAVIVMAIIEMAHRLGLRVTAEGIENDEQLSYLKEHGCDDLQGFRLAEPLSPGELVARLAPR